MQFKRISGLPAHMSVLGRKIVTFYPNRIDEQDSAGFAAETQNFLRRQAERGIAVCASYAPRVGRLRTSYAGAEVTKMGGFPLKTRGFPEVTKMGGFPLGPMGYLFPLRTHARVLFNASRFPDQVNAGNANCRRALEELDQLLESLHIEALKSRAFSISARNGAMTIEVREGHAFSVVANQQPRFNFDVALNFDSMPVGELLCWAAGLRPVEEMINILSVRPHALVLFALEDDLVMPSFLWSTHPELRRSVGATAFTKKLLNIPENVSGVQLIALD